MTKKPEAAPSAMPSSGGTYVWTPEKGLVPVEAPEDETKPTDQPVKED